MQMHRSSTKPILVSHALCPYVQRAAIVALEKAIDFERIVVDLANKPAWFIERSPTGKVPLLIVGETTLFESAAIAEYLDEISGGGMLPTDPIERARHRAWIEYASGTLAEIGALYSAGDPETFEAKRLSLIQRFERLTAEVQGPWFGGEWFGLVDAAFAPVFRYLDVFERVAGLYLLTDLPIVAEWRARLAAKPSVREAAMPDYPARLRAFLLAKGSHISALIAQGPTAASTKAA
jgi:glutathione S-transferase